MLLHEVTNREAYFIHFFPAILSNYIAMFGPKLLACLGEYGHCRQQHGYCMAYSSHHAAG